MLRRTALLATGLMIIATLGMSGPAGATASVRHIKPYDKWTLEMNNGGCEIQAIAMAGKWKADQFGDAGTYRAGGNTVTEKWKKGEGDGWSLSGTYASGEYVVSLFNAGSQFATGYLVKGKVKVWNDFSC
jgi:hypothetical protein